jgi:protein-S-isoprenylcysteine O-methyltransferase Ste14
MQYNPRVHHPRNPTGAMRRNIMVALKTLIFTIVMPGTVAGIIPWLLLQGSGGHAPLIPSVWMVGLLPLLLGVGLYLWCAGAFTFIGKGTPAPIDAPTVLVVRGPYRWVRNPMYVAVLSVLIGEAILFRAFLLVGYAILFWAVVHSFVVLVEEPSLLGQFGVDYETYRRTVPRWIPRLRRRGVAATGS